MSFVNLLIWLLSIHNKNTLDKCLSFSFYHLYSHTKLYHCKIKLLFRHVGSQSENIPLLACNSKLKNSDESHIQESNPFLMFSLSDISQNLELNKGGQFYKCWNILSNGIPTVKAELQHISNKRTVVVVLALCFDSLICMGVALSL